MSDSDIVIDNEKIILQDKLQEYLVDTKQASIAVGYFFISGFAEIMDSLKKMEDSKDPEHKDMKVKELYLCGIHREIYSWLEERGWYPKWYDGDALLLWKINKHKVDMIKEIQNHPDGDPDDISGEILKRLNRKLQKDK